MYRKHGRFVFCGLAVYHCVDICVLCGTSEVNGENPIIIYSGCTISGLEREEDKRI